MLSWTKQVYKVTKGENTYYYYCSCCYIIIIIIILLESTFSVSER